MSNFVLDIETGPAAPDVTDRFKPVFEAAGNLKDPLKIAQNILEKENAWRESLALDPITGVILAIGFKKVGTDEYTILTGDEKQILTNFWNFIDEARGGGVSKFGIEQAQFAGHYLHTFDFSFIVRRSWILGVIVPHWVTRYVREWTEEGFYDTAKVWQLNGFTKDDKYIKLDVIARALGIGEKIGEGKDFATVFKNTPDLAIRYLKNDLDLTEGVAVRLIPNFK